MNPPGDKEGAEFGKKLRTAREDAKMTLEDVQKLTGVNKGHISEIETGKANPTRLTMAKLAEAVGMRLVLSIEPPAARKRRSQPE